MRLPHAAALAACCALMLQTGGGFPSPAPATEPGPGRAAVSPPVRAGDGREPMLDDLPPESVEIAAVGDVNLGGRVGDSISARGAAWPWARVAPILSRADVAMVNLECTISSRGTPQQDKEFTFRGDPASVPAMRRAGVDIAAVANNHAVDFGRDAFVDTLASLRRSGITPVGGGADEREAYAAVVVERRGIRIGFVAATRVLPYHFRADEDTPGVASAYEESQLLGAVRRAKAASDVVVVSVHWGAELAPVPNDSQTSLARKLAGAGASVVIGHHAHVLQPVMRVRGALVAYSLGNFVFTSPSPGTDDSMILRVGIMPDLRIVTSRVRVKIVGGQPRPVTGGGRSPGVSGVGT
ncbi:MAG TPA: CapA family protein [Actinomycetota bacterium]|nr:CapA family protein [Actinomycetota bacterium]